jgi:hypothetical protein
VNWDRFAELKRQLKEKNESEIDSKKGVEMHITPYFDLVITYGLVNGGNSLPILIVS